MPSPLNLQRSAWSREGRSHGPGLLPDKLTAQRYTVFLQSVLVGLLGDVTRTVRLLLQHDRTSAHCGEGVGQWLNTTYLGRWIGRGGPDLNFIFVVVVVVGISKVVRWRIISQGCRRFLSKTSGICDSCGCQRIVVFKRMLCVAVLSAFIWKEVAHKTYCGPMRP
jgi:hypothetical protein